MIRGKNCIYLKGLIPKIFPEKKLKDYIIWLEIAGGIWLDPKENNVGTTNGISRIISQYENNVELYDTGKSFDNYTENNFIIDYEDVIFLTQNIINNFDRNNSFNRLPYGNYPGNVIYTSNLDTTDINEIYEKNYIYPSETLLRYELEYQKQKGNNNKVKVCQEKLQEFEQRKKQSDYEMKQRYKYGRNGYIGNRFSAKEIGIQVLQKTNLTRIKDMLSSIKQKFQRRDNNQLYDKSQDVESINKNVQIDESDPWRTL